MVEDEFENIINLLDSMNKKDRKSYNLVIHKVKQEHQDLLNKLVKNYNMLK